MTEGGGSTAGGGRRKGEDTEGVGGVVAGWWEDQKVAMLRYIEVAVEANRLVSRVGVGWLAYSSKN